MVLSWGGPCLNAKSRVWSSRDMASRPAWAPPWGVSGSRWCVNIRGAALRSRGSLEWSTPSQRSLSQPAAPTSGNHGVNTVILDQTHFWPCEGGLAVVPGEGPCWGELSLIKGSPQVSPLSPWGQELSALGVSWLPIPEGSRSRMRVAPVWFFFFFFPRFIYLFYLFYLFLVVLGLHCYVQASCCSSFSSCGEQAPEHPLGSRGLSCSEACGIFPDQGSKLCPPLWQTVS